MRYLLFFCAALSYGQITQGNGGNAVVPAAGVVKSNGTTLQTATAGTDYATPAQIPTQAQTSTSLFNDPALATWSAALHNASNQIVKVAVIGDSISRDNQTMFAGVGPATPANVWPRALASALQTKGTHGPGLITLLGDANGTKIDERITLSGTGWTTTSVLGPTQTGTFTYNSLFRGAAGATLDLVAATQADTFKFHCALGSDSSNGFSVTIDGGSATTICNTTGSLAVSIQSVSAPSAGIHTVHMVVPAGAGFGYLYGIEPVLGSTGVQVDNYSIGASRTNAYGAAVNTQLAFLDAANTTSPYSLVIIALRSNDEIHANGNTSAQYQTYLSNIVSHLNAFAKPPSILILDSPPIDTATYPAWNGEAESNFQAAEQAVVSASPTNAIYLSIASRWTSAANAQALSLMGTDKLHPIDKGSLDIANFVAHRILDISGTSPVELGSDYARIRAANSTSVGTFAAADQTLANIYRWGTVGTSGLAQLPGSANFLYHEATGFAPLVSLANDHVIFGGNVTSAGGLTDGGQALQFKGTEAHSGATTFSGAVTMSGTLNGNAVTSLPDISEDANGNFTIKGKGTVSNFVLGNVNSATANIHEYNFRQQSDGNLLLLDHTNSDAFLGGWNKDGTLYVTTGLSLGGTPSTTCDSAHRGTLAYTNNGAAKDNLKICAWNGAAYAFITLY